MQPNDRHRVFKRVETDEEFLARIRKTFPWWNAWGNTSEALDEEAWGELKMQRRIVECSTEATSSTAVSDAQSARR